MQTIVKNKVLLRTDKQNEINHKKAAKIKLNVELIETILLDSSESNF